MAGKESNGNETGLPERPEPRRWVVPRPGRDGKPLGVLRIEVVPAEAYNRLRSEVVTARVVTDDMIERAARVVHAHAEHRMPSGKLSCWDDLTSFQVHQFRTQAKAVLRAGLEVTDDQ